MTALSQIRSDLVCGQGRGGEEESGPDFSSPHEVLHSCIHSFHHVEIDESRWEWELELDVGRESFDQAV